MKLWDVEATRQAIQQAHGKQQLELARPCLRSLYDRQYYARFHYQRAERTLKHYVSRDLKGKDFLPIALGIDEPEWNKFNLVIRKIGADLTACIQSLHSLPDILASAVYFSLALNLSHKPPSGKFVNHAFVNQVLHGEPTFGLLVNSFRRATEGADFKHLAALANQSKHYSIVFPSLQEVQTSEHPDRYLMCFPQFKSGKHPYPQVYVKEFVPRVYDQLTRSSLEVGRGIHALLESSDYPFIHAKRLP